VRAAAGGGGDPNFRSTATTSPLVRPISGTRDPLGEGDVTPGHSPASFLSVAPAAGRPPCGGESAIAASWARSVPGADMAHRGLIPARRAAPASGVPGFRERKTRKRRGDRRIFSRSRDDQPTAFKACPGWPVMVAGIMREASLTPGRWGLSGPDGRALVEEVESSVQAEMRATWWLRGGDWMTEAPDSDCLDGAVNRRGPAAASDFPVFLTIWNLILYLTPYNLGSGRERG